MPSHVAGLEARHPTTRWLCRLGLVTVLTAVTSKVTAQWEGYNHPELRWFTLSTPHFEVHFHEGTERTAREVARIAEAVYEPITDLYGYRPEGKVHFIIRDHDDNSNGAAYYYDQKIEIWAPALDFELRGTHQWLPNVVTHEFSHLVSLGAARKLPRRVPGLYVQWIGYEKERRPDVIYGYPNRIVSYPLPGTTVPMWFAEGMAQYQRGGLGHDYWDTHRDMLLRTAVLADSLQSLAQMSVFGKDGLGNERVYNQGYALTLYVAKTYGEPSLSRLARALGSPTVLGFDMACRKVLGKSQSQLYDEWREYLRATYKAACHTLLDQLVEGEPLYTEGIANLFPRFSPDGRKLIFLSSSTSGLFSATSLSLLDMETRERKTLVAGVTSPASWTPDGRHIVYAKLHRANRHGSHFFDLFALDLQTGRSRRLTYGLRAYAPAVSPDGKWVACVTQRDGTQNLTLISIDGRESRQLTSFHSGETLYTPVWSPDGERVVVSFGREHGRGLLAVTVPAGQLDTLLTLPGDVRDPCFSPDGRYLYFSWDGSGIFNVYRVQIPSGPPEPVTNVLGGAFMPTVGKQGNLVYATFRADGYKLALLREIRSLPSSALAYGLRGNWLAPETPVSSVGSDSAGAMADSAPYTSRYGPLFFLPRLMVDYGMPKLGGYLYSSEVLDRVSILAGGAVNRAGDFDLFGIFEYRRLAPTFFVELYALSRHLDEKIEVLEGYPKVRTRIRFNLLEADIGIRQRVGDQLLSSLTLRHSRYTSHVGDFFFQKQLWVSPKNTYYVGTEAFLDVQLDQVARSPEMSIAPRGGRRVDLRLGYHRNNFFKDFSTDNPYGTLQEVYEPYRYFSTELDWREYVPIPGTSHSVSLRVRGGWIDRPVHSFFNFFAGGLPGLKGYPYYAIEGRKLVHFGLSYRLPLARNLAWCLGPTQVQKVYLAAFAESGTAFDEDRVPWSRLRSDAGLQLRLHTYSFHSYPVEVFFDAAYGLDRFQHAGQWYGKQWRFYFGMSFDFLDE
ncbi:MAG: hypothetical protein ONB23_07460 [candidate division KSB1 bacterium]|nr:hypothetical protein [candidate division KSB1 bacterium]